MTATAIVARELRTKLVWLLAVLLLVVAPAFAQAPIEERRDAGDAVLKAQEKTSAAYRDLTQAQYEAKLAEQDLLNADDAYKAAQRQADALKQSVDSAKKKLDAARARESAARKAYEQATHAADEQFRQSPPK